MNRWFGYLGLTLLMHWYNFGVAQDYTISAHDIGINSLLRGEKVNDVFQDQAGFIWLLTNRGFGRFDGYQLQEFTKYNSDLRSVPLADMVALDNEGYFWLCANERIDLLHSVTFEMVPFEERFPAYKGLSIQGVKQGPDGSIFIRFNHEEYFLYRSETGLRRLDFMTGSERFVASPDQNWVWGYSSKNGWRCLDTNTGETLAEVRLNQKFNPVAQEGLDNRLLFSVSDYNLKILKIAANGTEIEQLLSEDIIVNSKHLNSLFYHPPTQSLLSNFGTTQAGTHFFDFTSQTFQAFPTTQKQFPQIRKLHFTDRQGNIWAQTSRGLMLLRIEPLKFQQYPPFRPIRGIGLTDQHIFTNRFRVNKQQPEDSELILERGNPIRSVASQSLGGLWFATNEITRYSADGTEVLDRRPSASTITGKYWAILQDQEGRWWAGANSRVTGVTTNAPNQQDSLRPYPQYNTFESVDMGGVIHLLEDGPFIWACATNGLFLLHKDTGTVQRYWEGANTKYQLPFDDIHFLHRDQSGAYWAATNGFGLIHFTLNDEKAITQFEQYTLADGLSSNILYAILEDEQQRLWISTQNGISCFDKSSQEIQAFFVENGLQEAEFNRTAYAQDKDGRIFFGSQKGITAFYPDEVVSTEIYDEPIYVSQLSVYDQDANQLEDRTLAFNDDPEIKLTPSSRLFRLRVSMLDYLNSKNLRYYYRIEGLFEDYQLMAGNLLEIGGIPYGNYTLQIRGQGADRRYSTQELAIPLVMLRPFYLQWWFILLALGSVVLSTVQLYYWRIKRLQARQQELQLLVRERTAQIRKDKATIEADKTIIEAQAARLQELDELKSRFFANISHELRTPLTLILAPLNGLLSREQEDNRSFTYLKLMQQNGQKLLKRINELLDLSRLDANRLEVNPAPTFLYAFLKTLLSTFESTANLKGVQLTFKFELPEKTQILLDTDKVEKIISNFLSNALKFTPWGGSIHVKGKKVESQFLLSVSDTGIGIRKEELGKIFERFYQSKNSQATELSAGGTGIGLALSQELAKALDGEVWAESELENGSTFYLRLPFTESFGQETSSMHPPVTTVLKEQKGEISTISNANLRPHILVVEDNADLQQYLKLVLQQDYQVSTANNGKEALAILEEQLPALIISDIMMPQMDGIQLLSKLKGIKRYQHIPVIILTARQSLDVKLDALRIGVDDYLTKPFREAEVLARVSNLLRNKQQRLVEEAERTTTEPTTQTISKVDLVWLAKVEAIILANISQPNFKLRSVAEELHMSYRNFLRRMKQATGLNPKQYERSIKLDRARKLLKSGEVETVSEVMYQLGFDNHYYFSKMYKEAYGVMPSEEL